MVEDEHTCQGIGAIHKTCGAFDDLDGVHGIGIDLHTMLIAPLLPLLTDSVVDD